MDSLGYFILFIIGILQILFPSQVFMFGIRWQFSKGAQPSNIIIFITRIVGIILVIFSLLNISYLLIR
jgi:hypothetical protein